MAIKTGAELIVYFMIYSFAGWLLESTYAALREKKYVNRGFLIGPFCPIYGYGALLAVGTFQYLDSFFELPLLPMVALKMATAFLGASLLEYVTGYAMEKMFGCRWWDYSQEFLNLHGRVSVKYSLAWAMMAFLITEAAHPFITETVSLIPAKTQLVVALCAFLYYIADTLKTTFDILFLRQSMVACSLNLSGENWSVLGKYKRFFKAFPQLEFHYIDEINKDIRDFIQRYL